ncbi:MAG: DUF3159 domain-containing protein [Brachybacterium sp.]|nr:DUF3159 domain-containing protein [Brachybacterium sp.]
MSEATPPRGPAQREAADTPAAGVGSQLRREDFSAAEAVGGPRGMVEQVLPTLLFVILFVATREITWAAIAAVAAVALALLARLVQRQSVGPALGGLIGVGIGAIWAIRTGDGTDFYLPGIIINAVSAAAFALSMLLGRPLVALVAALFDPRVADWRDDPDAVRTYRRATGLFTAMYLAKFVAQVSLFSLGAVAALGVVKLVMGIPLFLLVAWVVWLMHRALLTRRDARAAS